MIRTNILRESFSVFEYCIQFSISYGSDHQCFLHNLKHKILNVQNPLGYLKAEMKYLVRMLIKCSQARSVSLLCLPGAGFRLHYGLLCCRWQSSAVTPAVSRTVSHSCCQSSFLHIETTSHQVPPGDGCDWLPIKMVCMSWPNILIGSWLPFTLHYLFPPPVL